MLECGRLAAKTQISTPIAQPVANQRLVKPRLAKLALWLAARLLLDLGAQVTLTACGAVVLQFKRWRKAQEAWIAHALVGLNGAGGVGRRVRLASLADASHKLVGKRVVSANFTRNHLTASAPMSGEAADGDDLHHWALYDVRRIGRDRGCDVCHAGAERDRKGRRIKACHMCAYYIRRQACRVVAWDHHKYMNHD